eukprot:320852-Chlamydomonas_euryale.AAC.1
MLRWSSRGGRISTSSRSITRKSMTRYLRAAGMHTGAHAASWQRSGGWHTESKIAERADESGNAERAGVVHMRGYG